MDDAALLQEALEAVADSGIDIVPLFFERFFEIHPEQRDSFNRPVATQGAMVNEMLEYICAIAVREEWVEASIAATLAKHHSYGDINGALFGSALNILTDALAAAAGAAWTPEFRQCVTRQTAILKAKFA